MGRKCPTCEHKFTVREARLRDDGDRWRCRCKEIKSCKDCPSCMQDLSWAVMHIPSGRVACFCPQRAGVCECAGAGETAFRICGGLLQCPLCSCNCTGHRTWKASQKNENLLRSRASRASENAASARVARTLAPAAAALVAGADPRLVNTLSSRDADRLRPPNTPSPTGSSSTVSPFTVSGPTHSGTSFLFNIMFMC